MTKKSNNVIMVVYLRSIILEQIEYRKRALLGKKHINKNVLKHLSTWFNIEELNNNFQFTKRSKQ